MRPCSPRATSSRVACTRTCKRSSRPPAEPVLPVAASSPTTKSPTPRSSTTTSKARKGSLVTDMNDAEPDLLAEDPAAAEANEVVNELDTLQRERDDLLDTTRRLQADFENYRKRVLREQTALVERS